MSNTKSGLSVKDLIVTGVFSAIIFICISLSGGVFMMMPALTFYYPVGAALLAGPVYLLMIAKVPKRGPAFIASALMAIFCFITGMLIGGVLAEIVAHIANYKSKKMNILSYVFFCLGGTGTYIAYFINPQTWVNTMLEKGTTQEYLDSMLASTDWIVLVTMLIGTIVIALFSGFVGSKLLKKQFERAGITA